MKDTVIKWAASQVGYAESPPGSNRVKYWDDWPGWQGQPWCVAFLYWVFHHAGEGSAFFAGAKTASCGTLYRWYKEQDQTVPKHDVQPGDIVILNFKGTMETQHCGLVVDVGSNWIQTIEGNTSPGLEGSQDNGGCVASKIRTMAQIVGVCRPKYKEEKPVNLEDSNDFDEHWAGKDIRWCLERGLLTGYPDGSFKPDQPVTRAEMAVVIRRIIEYVKGG